MSPRLFVGCGKPKKRERTKSMKQYLSQKTLQFGLCGLLCLLGGGIGVNAQQSGSMFTNERGGRGSFGDVGDSEGGVGGVDVGAIQLKACDVDYDGKVRPDSTTPVMKVLLKPGAMSEATGTGDLDVTLTVPRMHVAAGKPLFVLGWMAPGMSQPQPVVNL